MILVAKDPRPWLSMARRIARIMAAGGAGAYLSISTVHEARGATESESRTYRWPVAGRTCAMKTMLFVDDHPIYRDGLRRALEARLSGLTVVAAGTAAEAQSLLAGNGAIDLCLADFRLPDGDGLDLIAAVRKAHPTVAVAILCGEPTQALARDVRALGGVACLSKELDTERLVAAIQAIFDGEEVFLAPPSAGGAAGPLSDRRRDILVYASKGWPDKMISDELGITESTVRNHWHHIFRRLGVTNRTEAVTKALRQKLI